MSEELLVRFTSPTLAGLKTGSLFACEYPSKQDMNRAIRTFNRKLVPKGLCVIPLKYENGRALIYVYRPGRLEKDLKCAYAANLLKRCGYRQETANGCVCELMKRLKEGSEFPHEIGLFLGYPAEDVDGFMTHRGRDAKCAGEWKVYGNVPEAERTFCRYRKCREVYCMRLKEGTPLERLAVKTA